MPFSPASQRRCTCGHVRYEHGHSLQTLQHKRGPGDWTPRLVRTFSKCQISACSCEQFVEAKIPSSRRRSKAPPQTETLFEL